MVLFYQKRKRNCLDFGNDGTLKKLFFPFFSDTKPFVLFLSSSLKINTRRKKAQLKKLNITTQRAHNWGFYGEWEDSPQDISP